MHTHSAGVGSQEIDVRVVNALADLSDDDDDDDDDAVRRHAPVLRHRHPMFVRHAVQWIPEPIKSSLKLV